MAVATSLVKHVHLLSHWDFVFVQHQFAVRRAMAEAFVKTFKRDYVYLNDVADAETVMRCLPIWIEDYNCNHPHSGLKMKSRREFRSLKLAS